MIHDISQTQQIKNHTKWTLPFWHYIVVKCVTYKYHQPEKYICSDTIQLPETWLSINLWTLNSCGGILRFSDKGRCLAARHCQKCSQFPLTNPITHGHQAIVKNNICTCNQHLRKVREQRMNDNILMMTFQISKQIWQSRQKNGTCERNGTPKHTMPYCHMLDILSCLSSSWWLLALSADKTFSTQTTTCFPMQNNMKQESLEKKTPRKRHHTTLSFLSCFFVKLTHLETCSPNANPLPKTCHLERRGGVWG